MIGLVGYQPEDVYNCDETGLFFRALPDKTLALKTEKCSGGKLSKERLTVLHCVSMSGEKEPLLVIGKAARPRAFKKLDLKLLPVVWKSNKRAWMTTDIMMDWLSEFDRKMGRQKRKILLFMDNAGSHPTGMKLKNIKILFLPPNTTACCQPLDQGIIRNFKVFYRQLILRQILSVMDNINSARELSKSIDLLEAIYFIHNAWQKVTPETIRNCFSKAGFKKNNMQQYEQWEAEDDLPLSILSEMHRNALETGITETNLEDFIAIDANLAIEDDILEVTDMTEEYEASRSEEISDDDVDPERENEGQEVTTFEEVLKIIEEIKLFAKNQDDFIGFQMIKNVETHFQKKFLERKQTKVRQTSLLEFFKK